MSRTKKGRKAPGWEPWTNIRERELAKANYRDEEVSMQPQLTVDQLFARIEDLRAKGYGPMVVALMIEVVTPSGETQYEDHLVGLATSERTGVILLGRSFDGAPL